MHAVVNLLRFRDEVDPALFSDMGDVVEQMRAVPGFVAAHVVHTAAREVTLVIFGDDADALDRVATEVGSPWMVTNVLPLLAGPPDRRVGPVLTSG